MAQEEFPCFTKEKVFQLRKRLVEVKLSKDDGVRYVSDDIVENLRPSLFVLMKGLEMTPIDISLK